MTRARHGTNSRYALGCRCKACRTSHAAYCAEYRALDRRRMLRPAEGWTRIIRKLNQPQMTLAEIAEATGVSMTTLADIRQGRFDHVQASTDEKLRRLLDGLPREHPVEPPVSDGGAF